MSSIPWRRVRQGLAQFARQHAIDPARVGNVLHILHALVTICGEQSHSRQALYRIGCALLARWPAHLYVPVCPDYSHAQGAYTFERMGSGIPLLFEKHRPFVERVLTVLPGAHVTVLVADHERELQHLRGVVGVSSSMFERNIKGTLKALRRTVPAHWRVRAFTQAFPGFTERVWAKTRAMLDDAQEQHALESDTGARCGLYDRIGYPLDERLMCTAHVSAQYFTLGELAAQEHSLVVNHTTTSLRQYKRTTVGLLHNPVRIY